MANGHVRRMFPGGNTSLGFYSFYEHIVSPRANKIFILKGGPGVGKSSFMKGIAEKLLSLGMDIEYHHCSSDNSSLDGVYIPAIDVAFIDGTAPHRVVTKEKPGPDSYPVRVAEAIVLFGPPAGMRQAEVLVSQGRFIHDSPSDSR